MTCCIAATASALVAFIAGRTKGRFWTVLLPLSMTRALSWLGTPFSSYPSKPTFAFMNPSLSVWIGVIPRDAASAPVDCLLPARLASRFSLILSVTMSAAA